MRLSRTVGEPRAVNNESCSWAAARGLENVLNRCQEVSYIFPAFPLESHRRCHDALGLQPDGLRRCSDCEPLLDSLQDSATVH